MKKNAIAKQGAAIAKKWSAVSLLLCGGMVVILSNVILSNSFSHSHREGTIIINIYIYLIVSRNGLFIFTFDNLTMTILTMIFFVSTKSFL